MTFFCFLFYLLIGVLVGAGMVPPLLPLLYLVCGIWVTVLYLRDKRAARQRKRRVPERRLLWLSFLGGWPAAVVAGRRLRHKTQKVSYRRWFAVGVVVHCALLAGWVWVAQGGVSFPL